MCVELDQFGNTDGSYHATRDERERCNDMWVFRQADDSGGRSTAATSAHIDHLEVCAEFRRTRNAVTASNAAYPTNILLAHQRQQRQRPQQPQRSSGKVGGPQIGGMTNFAAQQGWNSS